MFENYPPTVLDQIVYFIRFLRGIHVNNSL